MNDSPVLFGSALRQASALLLKVDAQDGQQTRGRVEKVYWRHGRLDPKVEVGSDITYLSLGDAWGRVYPKPGQTIVGFVSSNHDGGNHEVIHHVRLEPIDGKPGAILLYRPTPVTGVPSWFSEAAKSHAESGAPHVPLDVLERYLEQLAKHPDIRTSA